MMYVQSISYSFTWIFHLKVEILPNFLKTFRILPAYKILGHGKNRPRKCLSGLNFFLFLAQTLANWCVHEYNMLRDLQTHNSTRWRWEVIFLSTQPPLTYIVSIPILGKNDQKSRYFCRNTNFWDVICCFWSPFSM